MDTYLAFPSFQLSADKIVLLTYVYIFMLCILLCMWFYSFSYRHTTLFDRCIITQLRPSENNRSIQSVYISITLHVSGPLLHLTMVKETETCSGIDIIKWLTIDFNRFIIEQGNPWCRVMVKSLIFVYMFKRPMTRNFKHIFISKPKDEIGLYTRISEIVAGLSDILGWSTIEWQWQLGLIFHGFLGWLACLSGVAKAFLMTTSVSAVYHLISTADSCTPARNANAVLPAIRLFFLLLVGWD
jgi:hypothetical protein